MNFKFLGDRAKKKDRKIRDRRNKIIETTTARVEERGLRICIERFQN